MRDRTKHHRPGESVPEFEDMECPYCSEIALPAPNGGECGECHLLAYF